MRSYATEDASERVKLGSAPRFRLHIFERAPRRDNAERFRWANRNPRKHPPIATSIAAYSPRNYSDLQGAKLAPGDIIRLQLLARGWVRIWLAPSGASVECPLRHLLHRDTFREVVWQQARGVMCVASEASGGTTSASASLPSAS